MKMADLVGLKWETELTEALVKRVLKADTVRVLPHGTPLDLNDFVPARATLYLIDGYVRCITNEDKDGGFSRVCRDIHPHEEV